MKTIGFHTNLFSLRGTDVAMFDYADLNEKMLGNKSIIIASKYETFDKNIYYTDKETFDTAYDKFKKRFDTIILYDDKSEIDKIVTDNNIDIFYAMKSGQIDGVCTNKCKTIMHCVFNSSEPHGDCYCAISEFINTRFNTNVPILHYMVRIDDTTEHLRKDLNIPETATVFGCYGGSDSFDLWYVREAVDAISNDPAYSNIYFIFMNITPFGRPNKNVIFLKGQHDLKEKRKFINTCDAMLYGRRGGETFGLACAEFSVCGKPIIANSEPDDKFHIDTLEDDIIYHRNYYECYIIITEFVKNSKVLKNIGYKRYLPEVVIQEFKLILDKLE